MSAIATTDARSLKPATDAEIFDALEPMFLGFGRDARELGQKRVALYVDAARGEPLWAVKETSRAIATGRAGVKDIARMPHPPEWGDLVRKASQPIRDARLREERLANERARLRQEEADAKAGKFVEPGKFMQLAARLRGAGKSL